MTTTTVPDLDDLFAPFEGRETPARPVTAPGRPAVTAASLRAAARRADYATDRVEDDGDAYSTDTDY